MAVHSAPIREPVFCAVCNYSLESSDQECLWCQLIDDRSLTEAGSPEPAAIRQQRNPVESTPCLENPGDHHPWIIEMDAVASDTQISYFTITSSSDNVAENDIAISDPMAVPIPPNNDIESERDEQGAAEQWVAPMHWEFERVMDLGLNLFEEVPIHRRRRLDDRERLEVAAKRGKVCEDCRRRKIRASLCIQFALECYFRDSCSYYPQCTHVNLEGAAGPFATRRVSPRLLDDIIASVLQNLSITIMTRILEDNTPLSSKMQDAQTPAPTVVLRIECERHVGLVSRGRGGFWTMLRSVLSSPRRGKSWRMCGYLGMNTVPSCGLLYLLDVIISSPPRYIVIESLVYGES